MEKSATILIVDDNNFNLDLTCKILARAGFATITATNGMDAFDQASFNLPQLILLDIMMPQVDGFETCKWLKENPKTMDIPIIFMTALTDVKDKVKGFEVGADDYITKPFKKDILLARVKSQLQEFNLRQTLKKKNYLLQGEIDKKYEAEISLLEINERLTNANMSLKTEIENSRVIALQLKAEVIERKQAEEKVKQSLKEKDLLLKEIHHRVKNNLFIVSSLLESQADYVNNPELIKILENSQNRIMSMALIHEQLHCGEGLSKIDFQQYLTTLTENIIDSCFTKKINFHSKIEQAYINIETAHPCGLIVNELISNAVEHAFPNLEQGKIIFEFNQDELGNFNLLFKDNGIGFPDDKDFYHSESLGLDLVSTLVEQLEGKIAMKNNNGTEITISFKELDYETRI